jgi:hypothetical protein
MQWAPEEDLDVNAAGRLSARQQAALRAVVQRDARVTAFVTALGLALVVAMAAAGRTNAIPFFFVGTAAVVFMGATAWSRGRSLRADVEEGVVVSRVLQVRPMTKAQVRAGHHTIVSDRDHVRLSFGHLARGQQEEWFARGGKFRFHYLPRTKRVVTLVHFQEPVAPAPSEP